MEQYARDVIRGELTLEYFARKLSEGWKVRAIDWSREVNDAMSDSIPSFSPILDAEASVPFGLHLTENKILQENPLESTVLLLILEQIVREKRIAEIAAELNKGGYTTRNGKPWSPADVFDLLPRVIEVGPSILKSNVWQERRQTM